MADDLNAPIITPTTTPPAENWTDGLDADTIGFLQNRGYDKMTAKEAAAETVKAYRNASKLMGAPPDQLLRIPHADALEEQQAFWRRLGAPEKAGDYDFTNANWDEGVEATTRFVEQMRKVATEHNMPKAMAENMVRAFMDFGAKETADAEASLKVQRAGEERELYQSWGEQNSPTFRANTFLVDRALERLKIDQPKADALRETLGLKAFSEMMREIGTALGEDRFVTTDSGGTAPRGAMTREQMVARLNDLKTDKGWSEKLLKGDKEAVREFTDLTKAIRGL